MKIFLACWLWCIQNKSTCLGFTNDNWKEIRLDIDKNVNPDIVGTLTDMKLVDTGEC